MAEAPAPGGGAAVPSLLSVGVLAGHGDTVGVDLRLGVVALLAAAARPVTAGGAANGGGTGDSGGDGDGHANGNVRGGDDVPTVAAAGGRLLLRVAGRAPEGAVAPGGGDIVLYAGGQWVGVVPGTGAVATVGRGGGWRLRLAWVGGVPPLHGLSSYALFLGLPVSPPPGPRGGGRRPPSMAAGAPLPPRPPPQRLG